MGFIGLFLAGIESSKTLEATGDFSIACRFALGFVLVMQVLFDALSTQISPCNVYAHAVYCRRIVYRVDVSALKSPKMKHDTYQLLFFIF